MKEYLAWVTSIGGKVQAVLVQADNQKEALVILRRHHPNALKIVFA